MEFRRSIPRDSAGIAEIEAETFPDPWSERSITDLICTDGAMCFSAVEDGRVIAYVIGRIIAPEGEIYRVAVRHEHRRRGIAYRLLDYAMKTARGDGLEVTFLEVRKSNIAAVNLYTGYGFRVADVRKNYYREPTEDALIMIRANPLDLVN